MVLQTFNTILNDLCNYLDTELAPTKIARTNTNVIYLLLKAYSKGCEVISNLVTALRNKFDPTYCSDEDLESTAKLVGTQKYRGSATGLQITVKNNSDSSVVLPAGTYRYQPDEDSTFELYNALEDTLSGQQSIIGIAMSTERKSIPITAQTKINVTCWLKDPATGIETEVEIPSELAFSCSDNEGLLGSKPETTLEFRERIVQGESTADLLSKMEQEIRQLPYIFDCRVRFNNSDSPRTYGNVTIPAWQLLIVISGNATPEIAEIVTKYTIFQTPSEYIKYVEYENPIFKDEVYRVYYKNFETYEYDIDIFYEADPKAIANSMVEREMKKALEKFKITNLYTELLQERTFSNLLAGLGLNTVKILNVDLYTSNGDKVDYIRVPVTQIAKLRNITINNASIGE